MNVMPIIAYVLLLGAVLFAEPDPMAVHVDENPPNAPAYVVKRFVPNPESAEEAFMQPLIGLRAEEVSDITEADAAVTPIATPLAVMPKLSPAIGLLTRGEMSALLREVGTPEEWVEDLTTIGWCESRGDVEAYNGNGEDSRGLWQLWSGWFPAAGYGVDDAFDPHVNAATAVYVRTARGRFGGPGGWTCADLNGIP